MRISEWFELVFSTLTFGRWNQGLVGWWSFEVESQISPQIKVNFCLLALLVCIWLPLNKSLYFSLRVKTQLNPSRSKGGESYLTGSDHFFWMSSFALLFGSRIKATSKSPVCLQWPDPLAWADTSCHSASVPPLFFFENMRNCFIGYSILTKTPHLPPQNENKLEISKCTGLLIAGNLHVFVDKKNIYLCDLG